MRPVIFWGGTGHVKVLAEALDASLWSITAVVDQRSIESPLPHIPILAGEAGLRAFLDCNPEVAARGAFAVAVGATGRDRLLLFDLMHSMGLAPLTIIHSRAYVACDAQLGEGAQVLAMAAVCAQARLGRAVIVNTSASVDHECSIGSGVHVAPGARLAGEVHVGECAFIGAGAVVLPRIHIGAGAIIGAGAVVTRDVPDNATVAGVPAKRMDKV
jgi:sugar O-acyltransferase (sialic acid O-acetyltransferase NeuD family)